MRMLQLRARVMTVRSSPCMSLSYLQVVQLLISGTLRLAQQLMQLSATQLIYQVCPYHHACMQI